MDTEGRPPYGFRHEYQNPAQRVRDDLAAYCSHQKNDLRPKTYVPRGTFFKNLSKN
jgi:hypothetical protein